MDVQKEEVQRLEKELSEAEEILEKERTKSKGKLKLEEWVCLLNDLRSTSRTEQDTSGAGSRDRETNRGMRFNEPEIIQGP